MQFTIYYIYMYEVQAPNIINVFNPAGVTGVMLYKPNISLTGLLHTITQCPEKQFHSYQNFTQQVLVAQTE